MNLFGKATSPPILAEIPPGYLSTGRNLFIYQIEEGLAGRKGVKDQQDPASKSSTLLWEEERNKVKSLIGILCGGFGIFMWKHHSIEFFGLKGSAVF